LIWLFSAVHHVWRSELHVYDYQRESGNHKRPPVQANGRDLNQPASADEALLRSVASLRDDQREVFLLASVERFSVPEVAYIVGMPVAEVVSRCARSYRNVRRHLG
jgi:DNA-directed RNA polymerase specialized sigma24 family protein